MKKKTFTKRKIITVAASYTLAAFTVLGGFIFAQYQRAESYKRQVMNSYRHAFSEFVSEIGQLDSALQKCVYAGTPSMLAGVCTDVYGKSAAAKMALGELPFSSGDFERTSGFITKAGDYAYVMARKAGAGAELSEEEQENLKRLSDTASVLSGNLIQLLAQVGDGTLSISDIYKAGKDASIISENVSASGALGDSLKLVESEFPEIPSLIYDGPFSEHISDMPSKLLEDKAEVSPGEAAGSAADFFGLKRNTLKYEGEREGKLPVYMFSANSDGDALSIEVTKKGGYVASAFSSRAPLSGGLSVDEAVQIAARFLQRNDFRGMKATYHMTEGNTALVNFAYVKDGVVCYPDLISVRVGLDNGVITGVECLGYITNHHQRELPASKIKEEQAREVVSKNLTVLSHGMAVIPTAGKNEVFCHEFKCEDGEGRHCIVYVNAETGVEEKILILQETENGTLTV